MIACFSVYFRKKTPWTFPKTSNSHETNFDIFPAKLLQFLQMSIIKQNWKSFAWQPKFILIDGRSVAVGTVDVETSLLTFSWLRKQFLLLWLEHMSDLFTI